MKIYADDSNLPYKTTSITPINSKRDIDADLARWGLTHVAWIFDLPNNQVELSFQLNEKFQDREINPVIRLKPPVIWAKKKRGKPDNIDWKISMRVFWWWIHNQLAMVYASQSETVLAFLSFVAVNEKNTLGDVVVPRLGEMSNLTALPELKSQKSKIIDVQVHENGS